MGPAVREPRQSGLPPERARAGEGLSLVAARVSRASANAPAAAPARVGTTYSGVELGLVRAAARPRKAKSASPHMPNAEPAYRQHPDQRRVQGEHDEDAAEQHGLVVGAERGDGEVFDRRRREIDGGLADRQHWRALRNGEAGGELSRADRDRSREHASHGPGEGVRGPGLVVGEGR